MNGGDLILVVLFVAFAVPGFVRAVRALPIVDRWVMAGVKPWSCDICMCFWSTGIWAILFARLFNDPTLLVACGPAYTIALILLEAMQRPPAGSEPPPLPPPLEEGLADELEGEG